MAETSAVDVALAASANALYILTRPIIVKVIAMQFTEIVKNTGCTNQSWHVADVSVTVLHQGPTMPLEATKHIFSKYSALFGCK